MHFEFSRCSLSISPKLYSHLQLAVSNIVIESDVTQITINFRDTTYSASAGGYHPVEISFQKETLNNEWSLLYITDFCYYGSPYAELVKEIDFDFSAETFYLLNSPSMFIKRSTVRRFYRTWENNFLAYLEFDAFDQIEVSAS